MPISGYFDQVFGNAGTLVAVPDAIQGDGSVSYQQGWGVDYTLPNTNPSYRFIPQGQFNQLFYDITSAIQTLQQGSAPAFITSTMNGGSAYVYPQYAVVSYLGVTYQSLVAGNADTPPSSKWQVFFGGNYLKIASNLSDLASAVTARSNLGLGTAATQNISAFLQPSNNLSDVLSASTSRTNLGLGTAATQNNSFFLQSANNLSDLVTPATARTNLGLGTAAVQNVSDHTKSTVASVSGSTTIGHVLIAADTSGTSKDGGAPNFYQATPSNPTGSTSSAGLMMGLAGALTPNTTGVVEVTISGSSQNSSSHTNAIQIRYGTGTAPTNGAAATGTVIGGVVNIAPIAITGSANGNCPFSLQGILTGLTISTAYWFDVLLQSTDNSSTATVTGLSVSIRELR